MSIEENVNIRFVAGSVTPVGKDRNPAPKAEPLLPPDIRRISASIEIADYTQAGVDEAIRQRYWSCVDELIKQEANSITLLGLPIASQLGRPRVLALLAETARKTGATADAHSEATVDALRHLGARRIAIASRWSGPLNEALLAYLAHANIEVLEIGRAHV